MELIHDKCFNCFRNIKYHCVPIIWNNNLFIDYINNFLERNENYNLDVLIYEWLGNWDACDLCSNLISEKIDIRCFVLQCAVCGCDSVKKYNVHDDVPCYLTYLCDYCIRKYEKKLRENMEKNIIIFEMRTEEAEKQLNIIYDEIQKKKIQFPLAILINEILNMRNTYFVYLPYEIIEDICYKSLKRNVVVF